MDDINKLFTIKMIFGDFTYWKHRLVETHHRHHHFRLLTLSECNLNIKKLKNYVHNEVDQD